MYNYLISLSYDGSSFHGWQAQDNAHTVQGEIENCLSLILKEEIKLTGCGRTDAGVHARFFVAHFDLRKKVLSNNISLLLNKINKFLPESIVIHEIINVNEQFHARYSAVSRTYKYFISRNKQPFLNQYTHKCSVELNIKLMQMACNALKQYSDFTSFSKLGGGSKTNICNVIDNSWSEIDGGNLLMYSITADRFLRNMVRSIVGTMLDVGREKINIADFRNIIESKSRSNAGVSIEAKGLFLWDVKYDGVVFNKPCCFSFLNAENENL